MTDALAAGKIDAFAAWEPTPTIAKAQYDDAVIVQRFITTAYLYFSTSFKDQYPDTVNQLIASVQRALNWLKIDEQNLLEASNWAIQAGEQLSGQEIPLSAKQYATIAREDLITPAIIAIISDKFIEPGGRLHQEFVFLKGLGMIPPAFEWES